MLSRVSSMRVNEDASYKYAVEIVGIFSQQAKRRMNQNLRRIMKNEDESMKSLADYVLDEQAYPWDIL